MQLMSRSLLVGGVAATLAAGMSQAQAEFSLSDRFHDADGDLVADIPEDASQWRDPDTLVFAYTPVEDPAVYAEVWDGFLEHMEDVTGKKVQFFPVQSNSAQIEAMRAGRLHVAGFNTGSNPLAVACAGYRPFAMMAAEDGSFGYEMEIITHPGSGIDEVEDIRGNTLTHTSETSNSGFKAPTALMASEFGMVSGEDYDVDFSGKHDNSVLGVANRDYAVATVANSVKNRMIDRGVIDADQIEVIYQSDTFPTTSYGTAHDLAPELQEAIQEAFFSFDWEGSALEEEFGRNGEEQFIPITFQEHWAVIRQIDEANGVEYACQ
ncbi:MULTISPECIES: phosphate/phosphite/phosphonate ABC transporter substrate-binding protein [Halomonas]|uniref:Phosphonate ABC transporter substrate-binding protein n=2 Tax=Halomonas TaxID=2745 RepID=A0ABQ0U433_9GAMM|nr:MULTISPECIES: phosphate/phosphite/phosphonate ABC transporter substrate-binding protein [Halomonas]PSJ20624.1 phosphate/phosphite/phosphonate ABC transporter substrate-binding protein [Halomonas sp. ND22Bw]MDR5890721.1 phosphate/phosphite/phosphonate ABC transporter substrate-binding protein [Halomonas salina]RAH38138.1 phosphate/phosphite/phosphonate ABC transporter substrate-binding protein [Halomonas sp. SL1]WJY05953.1 phosphate/phosphite/phosphonate ABC transporter substrate-binding prot